MNNNIVYINEESTETKQWAVFHNSGFGRSLSGNNREIVTVQNSTLISTNQTAPLTSSVVV